MQRDAHIISIHNKKKSPIKIKQAQPKQILPDGRSLKTFKTDYNNCHSVIIVGQRYGGEI